MHIVLAGLLAPLIHDRSAGTDTSLHAPLGHELTGLGNVFCAPQQEDAKELEARAKRRVEEFKVKVKTCKSADDYILALTGLGDESHLVILNELQKWLVKPWPEVRMAASIEVGKFKKNDKAAIALLNTVRQEKAADVKVVFLKNVGAIGARRYAKDLFAYSSDKEIPVAKAAVAACGVLKSKETIEPLIKLLEQLEKDRDSSSQGTGGAGGIGGFGGGTLGQEDDRKKRADELHPVTVQALKLITGEKFSTAKEYSIWWTKNHPFFKEQE